MVKPPPGHSPVLENPVLESPASGNTTETNGPRIHRLPPHVVNQIAAGEVVERPASVVKELVENALDASATRIEVTVSHGGRKIRVADNGRGMSPEDAKLAFYNHTTSKVSTAEDLSRLETLGFRGEALASISSISKLVCYTREHDASMGSKVIITEIGEPQVTPAGCAPGTVMEVDELFFNTPARLKFLKRPQTELSHVSDIVESLALSHPHVQFTLILNDKTTLKTKGSGTLQQTIQEVFNLSNSDAENLLNVDSEDADFQYRVHGLTSSPATVKASKKWILTFVNGRVVRCPMLLRAIDTAYQALIPTDRHPMCVLFLTLPHDEVDVNVHPTKKEVRYSETNTLFSFVKYGLSMALEASGHQTNAAMFENPEVLQLPDNRQAIFVSRQSGSHATQHSTQRSVSLGSTPFPQSTAFSRPNAPSPHQSELALSLYAPVSTPNQQAEQLQVIEKDRRPWRVVGQLFNTYILLETRQGLMVVDQHIASERTFFEALTRSMLDPEVLAQSVQQLMGLTEEPLSPEQYRTLEQYQLPLQKLGFEYTLNASNTSMTLTAMPLIYTGRQPKGLFDTLIQRLEETGEIHLELTDLVATLACHSAVRAGDILATDEMEKVIDRWLACTLPWTCPHGRPIAHTIKTEELQTFFDRPSMPVSALD